MDQFCRDRSFVFQREKLGFESCTTRIPDTLPPRSLGPATKQLNYSTFQTKSESLRVPHLILRKSRPIAASSDCVLPSNVPHRPASAGARSVSCRFTSAAATMIDPPKAYEPSASGSDKQRDLWKMSFLPNTRQASSWSVFTAHPSTTRRDTFLTCGRTKTGLMLRPSSASLSAVARSQSPSLPTRAAAAARMTVVDEQLRREKMM